MAGEPRFGTDGVRAKALTELTTSHVTRLGAAASAVLDAPRWWVGRDTRESGPALEAALVEGLTVGASEIRTLGVAPTPAVAHLCASDGAAGAVISASHNRWDDNGVKFFGPGGRKLDDATQDAIQGRLDDPAEAPAPGEPGQVIDAAGSIERYESWLVEAFAGRGLDALSVVVDCANGASHAVAPRVLRRLGLDPVVLAAAPDGRNINAGCGSTDLEPVTAAVAARPGSIGLAFDGDADRVLAVDERGRLVDGDRIIAMCARAMHARGALAADTVVVTVMANLGLRLALAEVGIEVVATRVGDRHVLEALDATGAILGGEQSGHVIFGDRARTGDGLLTALHLLDVVADEGRSLHELADAAFTPVPQVLENVPFAGTFDHDAPAVREALAEAEAVLGDTGRVLVRPSGTEPLVRIMVEAVDESSIPPVLARLRRAVADQTTP